METQARAFVPLELKYCERCGTLWLRPRGSDAVVCATCAKALAGLPGWCHERQPENSGMHDQILVESAFWVEGGNA